MTQDTPTVEEIDVLIMKLTECFSGKFVRDSERIGIILDHAISASYEEGVKAERERVSDCANTLRKTKKFPQQLIRHDRMVEYFERLSDSDIHYNKALDELTTMLSDNK